MNLLSPKVGKFEVGGARWFGPAPIGGVPTKSMDGVGWWRAVCPGYCMRPGFDKMLLMDEWAERWTCYCWPC